MLLWGGPYSRPFFCILDWRAWTPSSDCVAWWRASHFPSDRSQLHIDPYNWTGTNMVFEGIKKWKLYPPGQDDLLYVIGHGKSVTTNWNPLCVSHMYRPVLLGLPIGELQIQLKGWRFWPRLQQVSQIERGACAGLWPIPRRDDDHSHRWG